jgi:hypothetical protein
VIGFARLKAIDENRLRTMIAENGFSVANLSSRLTDGGEVFEYRMMIESRAVMPRMHCRSTCEACPKSPSSVSRRLVT